MFEIPKQKNSEANMHDRTFNENNQEGPHPMTEQRTPTPTIPEAVEVLTIRRHTYGERGRFYVTAEGDGWKITVTAKDADVLTRIHEIAAAMEAVK